MPAYKYEISKVSNVTGESFMCEIQKNISKVYHKDNIFKVIISGNPNMIMTNSKVPNYLKQFALGVFAGKFSGYYDFSGGGTV